MDNREINCIKQLRVYTSISRVPYTVEIKSIDSKMAIIRTKHLPKDNEIVTFEALDQNYTKLFIGNGRVRDINISNHDEEKGFAIEFDDQLPKDLLRKIQ